MIQITPHVRILVALQPVDFRKGIDGLCRVCREVIQKDPFSGTFFIFMNRQRSAIRILSYDGQGVLALPQEALFGAVPPP